MSEHHVELPEDVLDGYRGRAVLVLGASGFIGRWVARGLTECGARLVLAARDPETARESWNTLGISGDTRAVDLEGPGLDAVLGALLQEVRPVVTFNLAGYGVDRSERDERMAERLNAELPAEIARACAAARDPEWSGCALVHVGSAAEYGGIGGDLSEDSEGRPTTLYGRTKLAGTRALAAAAREAELPSCTARLFTVYGAGEHDGRLLPSLLEAARSGAQVPLSAGLQRRDFTYVGDAAAGLLRLGLVGTSPGAIFNLATGRLSTVREFIEAAAAVLGIDAGRLEFGALPTRAGEESEHDDVAVGRLAALLGWTPGTGVADGIRRTVALSGTDGHRD